MSKLVCIDSQIFIWGVKTQSNPTQEHMIPKAKAFIEWLDENDYRLLLPVPMLAELLSPVPAKEQPKIMALIDKRFQIAPFDSLAAYKCAELIHLSLTTQEIIEYREQHSVPKNKIKFDCMIAAIAITRKAHCIYSEDAGLKRFAANQINIMGLPNIGKQPDLFS